MNTMNRRAVLRGVGGAAIALPLLDIMLPRRAARAQDGRKAGVGKNGQPQRFLNVSHIAGHGPGWFSNTMGPGGLVLGPVLSPMEKHRKDLILIDGIDNKAGAGSGHNAKGTITTHTSVGGGISIDQAIVNAINWDTGSRWMATYKAGLIDKYKAISDGPGSTLFDNMLLYWNTECSSGNHTNDRDTQLIAGSAGGYLKTNQRLLLPKGQYGFGDLFVSFLNAFGIPATKFGNPGLCTGPLPGIAA